MPTIVDFPPLVPDALAVLGALFDHEPARHPWAE